MSDFKVNFPAANSVVDQVAAANRQISNDLAALDPKIMNALAMWESDDARAAYDAAKQRWDQAAVQMNQILEQARSTLTNVIENYNVSNQRAAGKWQ
ncbi:WXG100 family type VII secretion target [Paractinoplanes brasiliensis]|uniref:WXG100 family type VII secretion target n=1 Tax=Paractinoplanes brasiliensis TaxID=52695 RepID=A0A4R6JLS4_9ACTN|nr:WXG100 family type VII secretion target [Actinoplanes brasiliensis]TDO37089.1 WXG100 family type VII secretion target [Actinoplanes brasiliensis]GID32217.1 hypothetical protein Abr02nite_72000 [Actinoplanes brasiliensis]